MKIIDTSKPSIHFFILIGTPFISCLSYYIRNLSHRHNQTKPSFEYPLIIVFLMFIGELLAICFVFIELYMKKRKTMIMIKTSKDLKIMPVMNTQTQLNKSFPYLILIASSFLDFVGAIMLLVINGKSNGLYREGEIQMIQIFITMTIWHFLFHYEIYRHQVLSVVIIVIGSILLYITDKPFKLVDLWFILYSLINNAVILLDKWAIDKRYTSPYKLLGFRGFVGLAITLITIGIGSIACDTRKWYCESFSSFGLFFSTLKDILHYLVVIVILMFLNTGYILILKYYDPNQRVVTASITNVLILFLLLIMYNQEVKLELHLIANFLILIGAIIYNEIIVIYCFGLEYGTRKEIDLRSQNDVDSADILQIDLFIQENVLENTIN